MRILMTGAGHFLDKADIVGKDLKELMVLSGGNSGNYMIGHGAMYHLKRAAGDAGTVTYMKLSQLRFADKVYLEENFDIIVVAGANMINERADFAFIYRALKNVNLPVMAFGVGAQAESSQVELTPPGGTINFMKLIAERSDRIGVRGSYTAEVLSKCGVKNVEVNGCPSYYINSHDKDFRITVPKRDELQNFKVSLTMKRDRKKYHADDQLRDYQKRMFREGFDHNYKLVVQTEMLEGNIGFSKKIDEDALKRFRKHFEIADSDLERGREWLLNNVGIFFTYQEWSDFLSDIDFSYGARFHGNMMALMKGIPTLAITHDSRTRELCEFLNIPAHPVEKLVEGTEAIYELYDALDYSYFNSQYHALCDRFNQFMVDNLKKSPVD
ncbi:polysaccharide pyruvyl transferase family protein [Kordiimonas pumila]|uniref:Polysaccharide pyruvyl transferase family protein n=1 Tax=Kordiimonas pumila TaxID=2161677 RepID=A0ABV7D3F4_9PROT|nr:polysaccharide pyruvyl transferase family protein [Kordiimonas pumila]